MIVFVADAFVEQYAGGAELTTQALITSGLLPTARIMSAQITPQIMEELKNCFWIFGNFTGIKEECLLYAIKNLNYSVLEYDYKYCRYRSPGKHINAEGKCDCKTLQK